MRNAETQREWENSFLEKIYQKRRATAERILGLYPYTTSEGRYDNVPMPPFSWTCGFWGGIQWLLNLYGGDECFAECAVRCSERMEKGLDEFVPLGHDVGFQYLFTTVPDYMITGRKRAGTASLHAAALLAGRYNPAGKYIRAWNEGTGIAPNESKAGYAIIDCMMNLPLLYWAGYETGDPRFFHIAKAHAETVMKEFVREDGSVNHIVIFDPDKGTVVSKPRGQGYSEGSSWTRGQAWAIYGFAVSYACTGKREYLETSLKVAKYFINSMDGRKVPPIDFRQPKEPEYIDSTAGVIAASGMIQLKKFADKSDREILERAVQELLEGAHINCNFDLNEDSILQNGSEMYYAKRHHLPIIYGDYYLIEALMLRRGGKLIFMHDRCIEV